MTDQPPARQLPAPAARWLSATPAAGRLSAATTAGRLPAATTAGRLPAASATGRAWLSATASAAGSGAAERGLHVVDPPRRGVHHRLHPLCGRRRHRPGHRVRYRRQPMRHQRLRRRLHVELLGDRRYLLRSGVDPRAGLRDLELRLPPGHHRLEHRQVGAEVQGREREDLATNRFRHVHRPPDRPYRRQPGVLYRLPVPVVGRQAADTGRQDHDHGVCAALQSAAAATRGAQGPPRH